MIPNWSVVSGAWTQGATAPAPFNGTNYFSAGNSATAELRQDVDVTAWTATISARTQQFDFSAWVRSKDESPADIARIIIEYRDATNSNVIASLDSGAIVSTADWMQVTDRRTAPAGTGFIRVRLIATRANGTTNDAFFDQVVLRALNGIGVKLRGIISDDGLPIGSTITTNWTPKVVDGNVVFADASNPITTATARSFPKNTPPRSANCCRSRSSARMRSHVCGVPASYQAIRRKEPHVRCELYAAYLESTWHDRRPHQGHHGVLCSGREHAPRRALLRRASSRQRIALSFAAW